MVARIMNGISEILHCNRPGATDAITKPVIKFYLLCVVAVVVQWRCWTRWCCLGGCRGGSRRGGAIYYISGVLASWISSLFYIVLRHTGRPATTSMPLLGVGERDYVGGNIELMQFSNNNMYNNIITTTI